MKTTKLIKLAFVCAFTFFSKPITAQILTIDRENGQDSIQKKIRASFILNFSSDKQKNNIVDFTNKSEIDFFTKKNQVLIVLAQTELAFNGKNSLEKNGNLQIRFRDNDTRVAYPEAYIQYQWLLPYLFVAIVWVSRGGHSQFSGCISTTVLFLKKADVAGLSL